VRNKCAERHAKAILQIAAHFRTTADLGAFKLQCANQHVARDESAIAAASLDLLLGSLLVRRFLTGIALLLGRPQLNGIGPRPVCVTA
jgi:hypothetical protein